MKDYEINLTESEAGYVAGIIDGEGTITTGTSNKYYNLVLVVSNTNIDLMLYLEKILGGSMFECQPQNGNRPIYRISWTGKKAMSIIEAIKPYLIVKKSQAILAGLFQDLIAYGKPVSEDNLKQRIIYKNLMRDLNIR